MGVLLTNNLHALLAYLFLLIKYAICFKVNSSVFKMYLVYAPFKGHPHTVITYFIIYAVNTLFHTKLKIKLSSNLIKCLLKYHVQGYKKSIFAWWQV